MAYTPITCTKAQYEEVIYSGGAVNKVKIKFNSVELLNIDDYLEKITIKSRIIPNGSNTFMLENFTSKEVDIVLYRLDIEYIVDQVEISIGTYIPSTSSWEYVPIGIFNIQDKPITDGEKITIKLRDNSIKFDKPYNAQEIIELNGGSATKLQILNDICTKAGVDTDITSFLGDSDLIGTYDNTITGRTYLSYIAGQSGKIAIIDRNGKLIFVDINSLITNFIPLSVVESYKNGKSYKISKVIYEDGIRNFTSGNDDYDVLFLDSANPYISSQVQVDNILTKVNGFEINSFKTGKVLGNPLIECYDLISITDGSETYTTLSTNTLVYRGTMIQNFETEIGEESRKNNVTITGEATFKKYAKTEIDNINAEITLLAGEIIELTDFIKTKFNTGSSVELENTMKSNGAINSLKIKGFDLHFLYPGMAYPSKYTFPKYLNFYTIMFDTVATFDNEPHYFYLNSPIPLQKLGLVYDEIFIEQNNAKIIQRIGWNETTEEYEILSNPIIHEFSIMLLPTFANKTFIKVKYFDNLTYECEYIQKNEFSNIFATSLESQSQFTINQDQINSKVSKNGVISEINQTAEEIKINAEKIKLEGITTINEGFSVDLEGNATMNNATINGSTLYLADNTEIVGGQGVLTNLQYKSSLFALGIIQTLQAGTGLKYGLLSLDCIMPENFTPRNAKLTLTIFKTENFYSLPESFGKTEIYGKVDNIRLYKQFSGSEYANSSEFGIFESTIPSGNEIENALATGGYTNPTTEGIVIESIDLKDRLSSGSNKFFLKTANTLPDEQTDAGTISAANQTQMAEATLTVFGYLK